MRGASDRDARGWNGVLVFVAIAFALSWAVEIGMRPFGVPYIVRAILAMYGPAIAAFLVRGPLCREGFDDAGLGSPLARRARVWSLAALALVPACLIAGALVALAAGVQHVVPARNVLAVALRMVAGVVPLHDIGFDVSPPALGIGTVVVIACSIAPFVIGIFAFGEEFGWRGYLFPRLVARMGTRGAVLATGTVWGLWNAPLIVLDGLNFPTHRWAGVGMTIVFCIAMSALFGALRLRSRSVWPSTLAHGALNAQAAVVTVLLAPMGGYVGAPIGLIGALPFAFVGIALYRRHVARVRFPDLHRRGTPLP